METPQLGHCHSGCHWPLPRSEVGAQSIALSSSTVNSGGPPLRWQHRAKSRAGAAGAIGAFESLVVLAGATKPQGSTPSWRHSAWKAGSSRRSPTATRQTRQESEDGCVFLQKSAAHPRCNAWLQLGRRHVSRRPSAPKVSWQIGHTSFPSSGASKELRNL